MPVKDYASKVEMKARDASALKGLWGGKKGILRPRSRDPWFRAHRIPDNTSKEMLNLHRSPEAK